MARPKKIFTEKQEKAKTSAPKEIDFSCVDWEDRIKKGKSLLPDGIRDNLSPEADRALAIFERLSLPDVVGTPKLKGNCGQWARDLVQAVGGSVKDGVRWCREFYVLIPKKNAKALKTNTLVPTSKGFKTISEILVGDQVFGINGRPVNVIGKSEVFTNRKCYRVELLNSAHVICDADHLWLTETINETLDGKSSIKTTDEIYRSIDLQHQLSFTNNVPNSGALRIITNVVEVESCPTQCISVDADDGQFLITRDYIPTHNTTLGAAVMLTMLLINKRPNGEFLIISPSLEVSNLAFSALTNMISVDEELSVLFHVKQHVKTIIYRPTGAFIKVKSASLTVLTGSKPVGVLMDEQHIIGTIGGDGGARVLGQTRGGMVANVEAFLLTVSTQSERQPTGVFSSELRKARDVRDKKLKLPICSIIYEFPHDVDWRDPKNWWMVNPNNGYSLKVERLEEDFIGAQNDGEHEVARWASQHLNVEIGVGLNIDTWPGAPFWVDNYDDSVSLDYIRSTSDLVAIGIDGGGLADLLGLSVVGRHYETGKWNAWFHAWLNPQAFRGLAQDVQARLRDFEHDGDLTVTERIGEDFDDLVDICIDINLDEILHKIGVDPVGINAILQRLIDGGIPEDKLIQIPQGYRLNGAIKSVERRLAEGSIRYAKSRLMEWCVGNARTQVKGSAVYVTKEAAKGKIDPLIALFNAASILSMVAEKKLDVEDWIA